jgi:hypothetical protein
MATKAEKLSAATESRERLAGIYGITKDTVLWITSNYIGNVGTCDVRVFIARDNELINITWDTARAIGDTVRDNKQGQRIIRTTGWGYSRAQHVSDALSWALLGERGALKYREF